MKVGTKRTLLIVLAAVVVAALIWAFFQGRKERMVEAERERPIAAPTRVSTAEGRITIRMTAEEAAKNGIVVSAMKSTASTPEVRAAALVLPMQELNALRTSYVAAKAQLEKAQNLLTVSEAEYERLSTLYKQDRNASLKALQAAEGTARSDRTTAAAARDSLALAESAVRQQWGPVIAEWLFADSSAFLRLVAQEDLLVQVTPPGGTGVVAPATIRLELPGKSVCARFISGFPRLDPRIQSPGSLYVAPNSRGLVPGMNLVALLPFGPAVHGVFIPRSAVVWWQGMTWVYVQTGPDEVVQRIVPTDVPVDNGWIAVKGFSPGVKIVVRGAQQVLSEVFRSQIQVGEENK